jgi:hypothetical protein
MEVRMPEMNGDRGTTLLVRSGCTAQILMLITFNLDEYVYHNLTGPASA